MGADGSPSEPTPRSSGRSRALRTSWLTDLLEPVNRIASGWTVTVVSRRPARRADGLPKRWRHLFTFVGSVLRPGAHSACSCTAGTRARVRSTSRSSATGAASSFPSAPVAVVTIIAVGIIYSLVVPGRPRTIAKVVAFVVIGWSSSARLYLGVDHPFDVLVSIAVAVGVAAQRVPLLHPERGLPGRLPAGQDRAPRRRRPPRRRDPRGRRAPARPHRARHQAGRARRLGRLDAAAAPRRGRSRHVPVREALRDEPRARRPLVQARPDASSTGGSRTKRRSSRCGGSSSTRTTRCV